MTHGCGRQRHTQAGKRGDRRVAAGGPGVADKLTLALHDAVREHPKVTLGPAATQRTVVAALSFRSSSSASPRAAARKYGELCETCTAVSAMLHTPTARAAGSPTC